MTGRRGGAKTAGVTILLNGEGREIPDGVTVAGLLEHLRIQAVRVAVEINLDVVPRASFGERRVAQGDRVEVVSFVGGG